MLKQSLSFFYQRLGRKLITRRPVIHKRQKSVHKCKALVEVLRMLYEKRMQLVFLKGFVRQRIQKRLLLRRSFKFPGQLAQLRRAHAEDRLRIDIGDEFLLEATISGVLQFHESGLNHHDILKKGPANAGP